jgi:hypothetical protein
VFYLVAKSALLRAIREESLLRLDAFRLFSLRLKRLKGKEINLFRLMEISEHSACVDLRDMVYAMIGMASDCQRGELIPDYAKTPDEVYEQVILQHFYKRDPEAQDCTWLVHASHLVQRTITPLSSGIIDTRAPGNITSHNDPEKLTINGFFMGSVANMMDPGRSDTMWWAHPGLVKPIIDDSPLPSSMTRQSWTFKSYLQWILQCFVILFYPITSNPQSSPRDPSSIRRVTLRPPPNRPSKQQIYVPSITQRRTNRPIRKFQYQSGSPSKRGRLCASWARHGVELRSYGALRAFTTSIQKVQ